jgi:hypothetical protein
MVSPTKTTTGRGEGRKGRPEAVGLSFPRTNQPFIASPLRGEVGA